jgi:hypothetical protein
MKLFKSLLLGSAAGLVAVAGASAADLGAKKPAAATYVKECPTYGAGFFVVPGTTSCLKIIGRVRADYTINNPLLRTSASNTFIARGYFGYDHRTATDYGLLRTYVRGFVGRNNADNLNSTSSQVVLEYAFVQFGGFTAGRVGPTWEHGFNFSLDGAGANGGFSDISYVNTVGYSHDFGGGFKASLNLDSAAERRTAISAGSYAGQAMPDAVLALDYTQSWGAIKLAGAVHQVRSARITTAATTSVSSAGVVTGVAESAAGIDKTSYGFAGVLGAKFNLPVLNKGSNIWASATYAQGANSYAGFSTIVAGQSSIATRDATVVGNSLKLTTTYAVAGGVQLFVLPTVYVGLSGNYAVYNPNGARNTVNAYTARGTVGWVPVAGLQFVAEASYFGIQAKRGTDHGQVAAGVDKDNWSGRLRVQRDF